MQGTGKAEGDDDPHTQADRKADMVSKNTQRGHQSPNNHHSIRANRQHFQSRTANPITTVHQPNSINAFILYNREKIASLECLITEDIQATVNL